MLARDLISEPEALDLKAYSDPGVIHDLLKSSTYLRDDQPVFEVIQAFADLKVNLIPVLDEKNKYLGSISLKNLIKYMARITSIDAQGGIIVLEINEKAYSLSQLAQIVEANDAKVLSAYITSFPDSTKLEVTLKINKLEIGSVLQTFDRYGYTVKASWSDPDAFSETLRERYDSLMNYLNI